MELSEWIEEKDVVLLRRYLEEGGDPNIRDNNGDSPLQVSARYNSKECMKVLLEYKADPNFQCNITKYTPLHISVIYDHCKCTDLLIKGGANLNIQNISGDTPLHLAALNNSKDCIILLLECGADPTILNHSGNTFLDYIDDEDLKEEIDDISIFDIKEPSS